MALFDKDEGLIWSISHMQYSAPKMYGLTCTDSENIFAVTEKMFDHLYGVGAENCVNLDINLKFQYFHNFSHRLA